MIKRVAAAAALVVALLAGLTPAAHACRYNTANNTDTRFHSWCAPKC